MKKVIAIVIITVATLAASTLNVKVSISANTAMACESDRC